MFLELRQWCLKNGGYGRCNPVSLTESTFANNAVQWIQQVLLGAPNIEQTKLLDMDDLQGLFGAPVMGSRSDQRSKLSEIIGSGCELGPQLLR